MEVCIIQSTENTGSIYVFTDIILFHISFLHHSYRGIARATVPKYNTVQYELWAPHHVPLQHHLFFGTEVADFYKSRYRTNHTVNTVALFNTRIAIILYLYM